MMISLIDLLMIIVLSVLLGMVIAFAIGHRR
jgi:hypothetical protein